MASVFGTDTSCTTSLRTGRLVTGPRLVAEASYRRLTTPRGMLRGGADEANYGLDLADEIGSTNIVATAASLPGRISSELLKDERLDSVEVKVTTTTIGPSTTFYVSIEGQTAEGPFLLTLAVSDVTVSLLGIVVGEGQ